MSSPTDSLVRVRVKSPDVDTFVERFARNVSSRSIFLPSREVRKVGSTVRFEVRLVSGEVAFAGEGTVSWVKEFLPAEPTRVSGIGVRFTAVDPASEVVLARLVKRRELLEASAGGPSSAAAPISAPSIPLRIASKSEPSADAEPTFSESEVLAASVASLTLALPVPSSSMPAASPPPPALVQSGRVVAAPDRTAPSAAPAVPSREVDSTRTPVPSVPAPAPEAAPRTARGRRSAWAVAVALGGALVLFLARTTPDAAPASATSSPVASAATEAPAHPRPTVEPVAPTAIARPQPAVATPTPAASSEARAAEEDAKPRALPSHPGIQVDELLTGPTYERFVCSGSTSEFSLKAHGRVNVCFKVAQQTEDPEVTVVWKHEGLVIGKTPVAIPPKHPGYRTRAYIPLYEERLGNWSVRILSSKGIELAQTSFHVGP